MLETINKTLVTLKKAKQTKKTKLPTSRFELRIFDCYAQPLPGSYFPSMNVVLQNAIKSFHTLSNELWSRLAMIESIESLIQSQGEKIQSLKID